MGPSVEGAELRRPYPSIVDEMYMFSLSATSPTLAFLTCLTAVHLPLWVWINLGITWDAIKERQRPVVVQIFWEHVVHFVSRALRSTVNHRLLSHCSISIAPNA